MTKRGFTLVEVLLAAAILGASLVVLLTGASRCLAVMKSAQRYQQAQWTMGQGEVDHPMLTTNDVKSLVVDEVKYDNGYTYSRSVEDDEDKDGLYVVRIVVTWSERENGPREEVVRYVLQQKE
jgi:prepilin-type N-terminal cleavage/methylation domain-containing protein